MKPKLNSFLAILSLLGFILGCQQKGKMTKRLKKKPLIETLGNKSDPSKPDSPQTQSETNPSAGESIALSFYEDSSLEVPVAISGLSSRSASCSSAFLSYTSSNLQLVAAENAVNWGGVWPNCTAIISPEVNANGSTQIEITAHDEATSVMVKSITLTSEPVNDAPTVAAITSPQITSEDIALAVSFTAGDVDGALICSEANLQYTSDSPSIVAPTGAVSWSGTWPNCTGAIAPVSNANGTANITFTVSDGVLTASRVFAFTVNAVNDAPLISNVTNQSTNEDTALNGVAVTISDIDTSLVCATSLSAASSNTTVLPNANITIAGTAPNCTVSMNPAANQNGTATVTLTVTDGSLSALDTFVLTVNAVNDAPTISDVLNQSTNEDTALNGVAVTISDIDTSLVCATSLSAASSNTAVLPNANITIAGTAPSCTVSMNPASNQNGTATVTLTVTDGSLTALDTYVLTVNAVNDAPSMAPISSPQITSEDNALAVAFTAGDVDGALTCTAANLLYSSDTTSVVATSGAVSWSGTWPNCTGTISPVSNASGTANITFTVSDGVLTASRVFAFTATAVNDAPVISDVTNQSTNEDTALSGVAVTISDIDTSLVCATSLSAASSNTTVLPNANITIAGTAPSCTVSVNPAANQNGTSTVTLTVTDGSLTVLDTFVLTVNAVNDAPTITDVANQNTSIDTVLSNVAVNIADIDSTLTCTDITASSSNTALIPSANVTLSGTTPTCLISLSPALSQTGSSTITLTVSDSVLTASDTFVFTVSSVGWAQEAYLKASNSNASDQFGVSVALSGDTAVIGAYWEDSNQTTITNGATSSTD
ncbi:MAG: tandem-95 repeat protein, partial [Pseudomonadota bacterium]